MFVWVEFSVPLSSHSRVTTVMVQQPALPEADRCAGLSPSTRTQWQLLNRCVQINKQQLWAAGRQHESVSPRQYEPRTRDSDWMDQKNHHSAASGLQFRSIRTVLRHISKTYRVVQLHVSRRQQQWSQQNIDTRGSKFKLTWATQFFMSSLRSCHWCCLKQIRVCWRLITDLSGQNPPSGKLHGNTEISVLLPRSQLETSAGKICAGVKTFIFPSCFMFRCDPVHRESSALTFYQEPDAPLERWLCN